MVRTTRNYCLFMDIYRKNEETNTKLKQLPALLKQANQSQGELWISFRDVISSTLVAARTGWTCFAYYFLISIF